MVGNASFPGPRGEENDGRNRSTMTLDGRTADLEALLTPGEVAALFRVTPKTVTRWAEAGKLRAIRTLGGHRRFLAADVVRVRQEMEAAMAATGRA